MSTNAPTPYTKPQPVMIVQAIIAAGSVVITALGAINWADHPSWPAVAVTLLPALSAAYTAYQAIMLPKKVVPLSDTVHYIDENGQTVDGPAAPPALSNVVGMSTQPETPADPAPAAPEAPAVPEAPAAPEAPAEPAPADPNVPQPVTDTPKAPGE